MEKHESSVPGTNAPTNQSRADGLMTDSPVTASPPSNVGYCRELGAQPSNTAPPNCIDSQSGSLMLHSGIDSLYVSFYGELFEEVEQSLEKLKSYAQSPEPCVQSEAVLHIGDHDFYVKPTGRGRFLYVITDNWFHIQLSASVAKRLPLAYVQISSELLNRADINLIFVALKGLMSSIATVKGEPRISRADIYTDFCTWTDLAVLPRQAWVSRSNSFHQYYDGKNLTGFVFGEGGDLSCRLYNKTVEIQKSKKTYFNSIWAAGGWDGVSDVWRLEYQFRRSVLNEFNINQIEVLQAKLPLLWQYCTQQWLKLTMPSSDDKTQTRWALHPLWKLLINGRWDNSQRDHDPLSRIKKSRIPDDTFLFTNGLGAITSFMAIHNIDSFDEAADQYLEQARYYYLKSSHKTGHTINSYTREKSRQKERRYNTLRSGKNKTGRK